MRIKEVIKARNLTIKKVAEIMGVEPSSLSRAINKNTTVEMLSRIAKAIGCSEAEFFEPFDKNKITCPKCGAMFEFKEKE